MALLLMSSLLEFLYLLLFLMVYIWWQAQQLLTERNTQLQEQLEEITHKFINRESREEDLSRIKELENEIVQWGNKVKKLEEEMKFYKLELINREDNFNNKFGGGPNVG